MSEEYGRARGEPAPPEDPFAPAARPWVPGPRDALVTGMGFCLPGAADEPVRTAGQVWATAATGASHVERDGFHHGTVRGAREAFEELLPDVPSRYLRSYADVHLYGMVSLVEACRDAGLDHTAGELRGADVLTARAGVDSNYDSYRAWHDAIRRRSARGRPSPFSYGSWWRAPPATSVRSRPRCSVPPAPTTR